MHYLYQYNWKLCVICLTFLTFVCHSQQLIPYVEDDGSKNDDRAGPPRFASEERREIAEVNKVSCLSVCFIFPNY